MPEWIYGVLLASIGASGAWLTYLTTRRSADGHRLSALEHQMSVTNKRNIRLINYATRLRRQIVDGGGEPEEWPDDLYDD